MIRFVMYQPGCPCCCSEQPLLVKDAQEHTHSIGVGDINAVIPDLAILSVYEAPYESLEELYEAFRKDPVTWESSGAWKNCTKTNDKVFMKTHRRVL